MPFWIGFGVGYEKTARRSGEGSRQESQFHRKTLGQKGIPPFISFQLILNNYGQLPERIFKTFLKNQQKSMSIGNTRSQLLLRSCKAREVGFCVEELDGKLAMNASYSPSKSLSFNFDTPISFSTRKI